MLGIFSCFGLYFICLDLESGGVSHSSAGVHCSNESKTNSHCHDLRGTNNSLLGLYTMFCRNSKPKSFTFFAIWLLRMFFVPHLCLTIKASTCSGSGIFTYFRVHLFTQKVILFISFILIYRSVDSFFIFHCSCGCWC